MISRGAVSESSVGLMSMIYFCHIIPRSVGVSVYQHDIARERNLPTQRGRELAICVYATLTPTLVVPPCRLGRRACVQRNGPCERIHRSTH